MSELNQSLIKYARESIDKLPDVEEYDRMISGVLYDSFVEPLERARIVSTELCLEMQTLRLANYSGLAEYKQAKSEILVRLFGKIGKNVVVEPPFSCDYGFNIVVGDNFYANYNAAFLDASLIVIGHNCLIGPNVTITTAGHPLDVYRRSQGDEFCKPIFIGDNCWLGANCVVLPGVTIGDNVVIGAGAVVTKDIDSNSLVVGIPARVVKKLTTFEEAS